jgi:hypothetical protein
VKYGVETRKEDSEGDESDGEGGTDHKKDTEKVRS